MTRTRPRASWAAVMQTQAYPYRTQLRREGWKALAGILAAVAVMSGMIFALSSYIGPTPLTINIHVDAPLTIGTGRSSG